MSKCIEIGPKEVYISDGNIVAVFENHCLVFIPEVPIDRVADCQECAKLFVADLMMMSNIEQIEQRLMELGFKGTIKTVTKS